MCVFLLFAKALSVALDNLDVESPIVSSVESIIVEHNLGANGFIARGKFSLNLLTDGKYSISDVDKVLIKNESTSQFKKLLSSDSLYQIRFKKAKDKEYIYISIPACALQISGFKEDIVLFVGEYGNLVAANYQSPVIGLPRTCDAKALSDSTNFLTRIKIGDFAETQIIPIQATGPKPGNLAHVNVAVTDAEGRTISDPTAKPEQQSFLRRYWYIILAALAWTMLSPADDRGAKKPAAAKAK